VDQVGVVVIWAGGRSGTELDLRHVCKGKNPPNRTDLELWRGIMIAHTNPRLGAGWVQIRIDGSEVAHWVEASCWS
jgi:hypothetical protein